METTHKLTKAPLLVMTMAALLCAGPSLAQVSTIAPPAMGATSPLAAVGPVGIPLGAVELSPGGLSSTTLGSMGTAACSVSSTAMAGSNATYDGGGLSGTASGSVGTSASTMPGTCNPTSSYTSSSGTAANSAIAAGSSSGKVGIPLGATEIQNLGISPMLTIPSPSVPASGLTTSTSSTLSGTSGLSTTCGNMTATDMSSPLGC
jgi:hypothetical protein